MSKTTSTRPLLRLSATEAGFEWFQRAMAAYCLLFGVLYWIRLIGLHDGALWRFDLMPVHWQVASVTLAVFFPFASIGLWMFASWGAVIWFICAVTEALMYAGFPDLFGHRHSILIAHALVLLLYATFRIVIHMQRRDAET